MTLGEGEPTSKGYLLILQTYFNALPYNNIEALKNVFAKFGHEIAGVIIEPVAGNMNWLTPIDGFLQGHS